MQGLDNEMRSTFKDLRPISTGTMIHRSCLTVAKSQTCQFQRGSSEPI